MYIFLNVLKVVIQQFFSDALHNILPKAESDIDVSFLRVTIVKLDNNKIFGKNM